MHATHITVITFLATDRRSLFPCWTETRRWTRTSVSDRTWRACKQLDVQRWNLEAGYWGTFQARQHPLRTASCYFPPCLPMVYSLQPAVEGSDPFSSSSVDLCRGSWAWGAFIKKTGNKSLKNWVIRARDNQSLKTERVYDVPNPHLCFLILRQGKAELLIRVHDVLVKYRHLFF